MPATGDAVSVARDAVSVASDAVSVASDAVAMMEARGGGNGVAAAWRMGAAVGVERDAEAMAGVVIGGG